MFISADQLVAHAVGDYILQSHWMATEKTKKSVAALAHAIVYTLPFLLFTSSWLALAAIMGTHFLLDRFRLARYVVWAKNLISPPRTLDGTIPTYWWLHWNEVASCWGYPPRTPMWLACWLLIIVDNILHVVINAAALRWL